MKLFHMNVVCSDFDASYAFYTEKVGLVPLTRRGAGIKSTPEAAAQRKADGRLPGEARTRDEDQEGSRRALGMDGHDMGSRGVLLYWPDSPQGPYIDLLQWYDGGKPIERDPKHAGFARMAMQVEDIQADYERLKERGVEFVSEPVEILLGATKIKIAFFPDPDGTLLELVEVNDGKGWGN